MRTCPVSLPDRNRPLDRGKQDAPKTGNGFAKRDVKPDLRLSSPSQRALTNVANFQARFHVALAADSRAAFQPITADGG